MLLPLLKLCQKEARSASVQVTHTLPTPELESGGCCAHTLSSQGQATQQTADAQGSQTGQTRAQETKQGERAGTRRGKFASVDGIP